MPGVRIKYLNFYYTITRKQEEYIAFDKSLPLWQLLNTLSERYGQTFRDALLDMNNKLKPNSLIMVDRKVINNLGVELKDGGVVMISLALCGG